MGKRTQVVEAEGTAAETTNNGTGPAIEPDESAVADNLTSTDDVEEPESEPERERVPRFGDPRRAVVDIVRDRLERMLQPVDDPKPVAWLADGEYDRLYWAIARARGREGGSTSEDEELGQAILRELEAIQSASDTPVWQGVNVITARDLDAATAEPLPPASIFSGSVRTPAFVYVSAVCPVCGIATEIDIEIGVKLIVEGHSRKLKLTAKAPDKPHQCGQQRLEDLGPSRPVAAGQTSLFANDEDGDQDEDLEVADGKPGFADRQDDDPEVTDREAVHALAGVKPKVDPRAPLCEGVVDGRRCNLDAGHEGDHDPDAEALPF